ncbi:MAG: hypothetical protein ABIA76_05405 [Candidatus Diapherotrites archaeon]
MPEKKTNMHKPTEPIQLTNPDRLNQIKQILEQKKSAGRSYVIKQRRQLINELTSKLEKAINKKIQINGNLFKVTEVSKKPKLSNKPGFTRCHYLGKGTLIRGNGEEIICSILLSYNTVTNKPTRIIIDPTAYNRNRTEKGPIRMKYENFFELLS